MGCDSIDNLTVRMFEQMKCGRYETVLILKINSLEEIFEKQDHAVVVMVTPGPKTAKYPTIQLL